MHAVKKKKNERKKTEKICSNDVKTNKQQKARCYVSLGKVQETLKAVLCYFSGQKALDTVNSPGNLSQMIKYQLRKEKLKTLGRGN